MTKPDSISTEYLVLSSDDWTDRVSTGDLNLTPGWHEFELRISNGDRWFRTSYEPRIWL